MQTTLTILMSGDAKHNIILIFKDHSWFFEYAWRLEVSAVKNQV